MNGNTPREVRLAFPAKPQYLLLARLALVGLTRSLPVDEDTVADLKLAVTEACGNVVRHAYADEDGRVSVTFFVESDRFEMIVEDEGSGVAPSSALAEAPLPVETGEAHEPAAQGMGMAIIRAVVDELDVTGGSHGAGTRVRMTKKLAERTLGV